MKRQQFVRGISRISVGTAAIYTIVKTLQRMGQRHADRDLARGKRILILGGGFAGVAVARELARLLPDPANGELCLVDEDNYLLFTPMLTEAAGGELQPDEIVSPARSLGRRIRFMQASVKTIDLGSMSVVVELGKQGLGTKQETITANHLIIALGSVVNFHNTPGVAENSISMKRLPDAAKAYEHVSACLERAAAEPDKSRRVALLTFVVGGGGYTGVETMAAINDLIRTSVKNSSYLDPAEVRTIIIHPGDRLLPEITADLASYATDKLKQRGVEVRLHTKISGAGPDYVEVSSGERISAQTLIWAAGVTPNPLLETVAASKGKHHGLQVNGCMQIKDRANAWALGDCAEIPKPDGKSTYAPTAQNATREGKLLAQNILRSLRGEPLVPFVYTPVGELALVGRRSGVARVYGRNFSGLLAWAMWRAIYLAKMPSTAQQGRILLQWLLDLAVGRAADPLSTGSETDVA